ncbi:hypothetical protein [Actinomadura sp. SCN-SB]|uniref:hypothetical protein n=1 Tax=Actinomadura sp. SCN-SB TaxID=3373092 RepID=UPI0037504ED4
MTDLSEATLVDPDRVAWDAVSTLLTQAADLAADDDIPITGHVLEAGAFGECRAWHLHEDDAAPWVLRQARFQIACTLALPPRDPDDPLIDTMLEVLARHPTRVQARVLRAAAARLPHRPADASAQSTTDAHGQQLRTPRP